jgi:FYVE/RhoGEF/PH domain-containing protein 5/6
MLTTKYIAIEFPAFEPSNHSKPVPRPPHLPFRRISLPTAPQQTHRQSITSVASFNSTPEGGSANSGAGAEPMEPKAAKKKRPRPASTQLAGRAGNRRPVDEARESKRRKVIHEFYETEKAYIEGLELIYSVRTFRKFHRREILTGSRTALLVTHHRIPRISLPTTHS